MDKQKENEEVGDKSTFNFQVGPFHAYIYIYTHTELVERVCMIFNNFWYCV